MEMINSALWALCQCQLCQSNRQSSLLLQTKCLQELPLLKDLSHGCLLMKRRPHQAWRMFTRGFPNFLTWCWVPYHPARGNPIPLPPVHCQWAPPECHPANTRRNQKSMLSMASPRMWARRRRFCVLPKPPCPFPTNLGFKLEKNWEPSLMTSDLLTKRWVFRKLYCCLLNFKRTNTYVFYWLNQWSFNLHLPLAIVAIYPHKINHRVSITRSIFLLRNICVICVYSAEIILSLITEHISLLD